MVINMPWPAFGRPPWRPANPFSENPFRESHCGNTHFRENPFCKTHFPKIGSPRRGGGGGAGGPPQKSGGLGGEAPQQGILMPYWLPYHAILVTISCHIGYHTMAYWLPHHAIMVPNPEIFEIGVTSRFWVQNLKVLRMKYSIA